MWYCTNAGIYLQCCVDSQVHMRVGGNFYFDPKPGDSCPDLLLIAGGVGINPIYSIVKHVADISQYQHTGKIVLLFSAQNQDELLFKVHVHCTSALINERMLFCCLKEFLCISSYQ